MHGRIIDLLIGKMDSNDENCVTRHSEPNFLGDDQAVALFKVSIKNDTNNSQRVAVLEVV